MKEEPVLALDRSIKAASGEEGKARQQHAKIEATLASVCRRARAVRAPCVRVWAWGRAWGRVCVYGYWTVRVCGRASVHGAVRARGRAGKGSCVQVSTGRQGAPRTAGTAGSREGRRHGPSRLRLHTPPGGLRPARLSRHCRVVRRRVCAALARVRAGARGAAAP
eukprot:3246541-Prymnesium_polylepis.1